MFRVLGRGTSGNVQKVVWLLEELGQPYSREDYGRQFGNTTDAAYLKLNPSGKVPTLVDGDVSVWESNTILRYIANKVGTPLYPTDPVARSQVERWMDWLLASLNGSYVAIFKESKKAEAERAPSFAADAKELRSHLDLLNGAMAGRKFVAGDAMSLADIALGPIVHRCLDFPIDVSGLDRLQAWRAAIAARPAFKKAVGG
jgi:glutathione S-transferase